MKPKIMNKIFCLLILSAIGAGCSTLRGTGDLGLIVERAVGRVTLIDTTQKEILSRVDGLGDLSHASVVYSRDGRFAFVFGRDGGLTRIDLLKEKITHRIVQAGNAIGGAISQDGSLVAVSNYEPGGIKVFRASDLSPVADISTASKVVGLVEAPQQRFVFSLFEAGEIWVADLSNVNEPTIEKYKNAGREPYDALITSDGRYYIAGLYGEDGIAVLDLWYPKKGIQKKLKNYGRGANKLPVYKMPHMEGWASSGGYLFVPAVGAHELLVVDQSTWKEIGRVKLKGQPVFAIPAPASRYVWVNFALPHNQYVQIVDRETFQVVQTLEPGRAVLHIEFAPKGESAWISIRDEDRVEVYDTKSFLRVKQISVDKPSGIFFTARASKLGM